MLQLHFQHVSIAKPGDGSHIDIRTTTPRRQTFLATKKAPFRMIVERGRWLFKINQRLLLLMPPDVLALVVAKDLVLDGFHMAIDEQARRERGEPEQDETEDEQSED